MVVTLNKFAENHSRLGARVMFDLQFAYAKTKYLSKFYQSNVFFMQSILNRPALLPKLEAGGKSSILKVMNQLESDWIDNRKIVNGTAIDEGVLSETAKALVAGLLVEAFPHKLAVGFNSLEGIACDVYQYMGRGSSFEITNLIFSSETRITVKNVLNSYGDESYIFAIRMGDNGISFEVADAGSGAKGVSGMRVYAYAPDCIMVDNMEKYIDTSLFTQGIR